MHFSRANTSKRNKHATSTVSDVYFPVSISEVDMLANEGCTLIDENLVEKHLSLAKVGAMQMNE